MPNRIMSCGITCTPNEPLGDTIVPTESCPAASNSGCSDEHRNRSGTHDPNTTLD
ncbi:MAG: hypothetical protein U0165_20570 [Polyangiaceae bacterium]